MMHGQAEVFDLGYQHYTGPREGRNRARRAVFENGVRSLLGIGRGGRAKILPALLFISAMLPALVFVVVLSFAQVGDTLPGPADYYSSVGLVLVIFGAIMAPELLIPDRQNNVLQLYLVRPLSTTDYVAARFLAFFMVVLLLVYSGQVFLQVGLALTDPDQWEYLKGNWLDVPRALAAGVVVALFVTAIPMAAAAVISRRAYVAAFVIALFLVTNFTANALVSTEDCDIMTGTSTSDSTVVCESSLGDAAPYVALIDMFQVPLNISNMIFDTEGGDSPSSLAAEELNSFIPIGVYLIFTLAPILFLWRKYRRLAL